MKILQIKGGIFMNNSKLVRNIKEECKQRKIQLGVLLKNCNLNQGFLYEIEKKK